MKKKPDNKVNKQCNTGVDDTIEYIIPMRKNRKGDTTPIKCKVAYDEKSRSVKVLDPNYPGYIFTDTNFNYYLLIGYIKIAERNNVNE